MGKYHFIAIGGIGMSGLAKYLLQDGHTVTGSDIADSKYIDALKELGAGVNIGHSEANLPDDTDVVVVSTAIKENNPELVKAKSLGMKIYHRSDLLAEIAKSAQDRGKCFIGFSGTHGKTTTSGMASFVLDKAGLEPSFVDGGIVPELHTNAQHKGGNHFVAELDESDGTIVKYNPDILVVNNLEEDHLDFYKNGMTDLLKTFEKAISQSKKVLVNNDNEGVVQLLPHLTGRGGVGCQPNNTHPLVTFGLKNADYVAKNIDCSKEGTRFEVYYKGELLTDLFITVAGVHNVYNTLAVCAALNEAGVDVDSIKNSFTPFTGMGRRFEKVCEINGVTVYDDYAHHPTEIKATLDAASLKFGKENIVAVFQPHRYTRLHSLWNDFKTSFAEAGRVIVTDVYAASEDPIDGVSGEKFASEIGAEYFGGSIADVADQLKPTLNSGNIVIGLGAGTITKLGKSILEAECK